jgi:hypothetical protein
MQLPYTSYNYPSFQNSAFKILFLFCSYSVHSNILKILIKKESRPQGDGFLPYNQTKLVVFAHQTIAVTHGDTLFLPQHAAFIVHAVPRRILLFILRILKF